MKRTVLLIIGWFVFSMAFSQSIEKMRVSYTFLHRDAKEQSVPLNSICYLSFGEDGNSVFFPQSTTIINDKPVENTKGFRVYKNAQDNLLTYREGVAYSLYYYTEKTPQYQWEIQDGDTVVCDYPCQKAVTTFRGRTWTV